MQVRLWNCILRYDFPQAWRFLFEVRNLVSEPFIYGIKKAVSTGQFFCCYSFIPIFLQHILLLNKESPSVVTSYLFFQNTIFPMLPIQDRQHFHDFSFGSVTNKMKHNNSGRGRNYHLSTNTSERIKPLYEVRRAV